MLKLVKHKPSLMYCICASDPYHRSSISSKLQIYNTYHIISPAKDFFPNCSPQCELLELLCCFPGNITSMKNSTISCFIFIFLLQLTTCLSGNRTKGNRLKLQHWMFHLHMRKNFFTVRVKYEYEGEVCPTEYGTGCPDCL